MALVCTDLCFSYHGQHSPPVLDGISLEIKPGTVTAILGPNGSGKSTLVRLLLGLLKPASGSVMLDGQEIRSISEPARAAQLVYIPQRPSVAFAFSVLDIVAMGPSQSVSPTCARAIAAEVLDSLAMAELRDVPFSELSVGQQQRVVLARALAQCRQQIKSKNHAKKPVFLLADEPASAMDPKHALETMAVLTAQARAGAGIAIVLHDLTAALQLADRVVLLDARGRIAVQGDPYSVLSTEMIERIFGVCSVRIQDTASGLSAIIPTEPSAEPRIEPI